MYNKAVLVGNLGRDPEIRYTANGTAVCKFSLATTRRWNDGERTEWHRIVTWGKLAETCHEYLAKGRLVFVTGEIRYDSYEDSDGNRRHTTEIHADTVKFLGRPGTVEAEAAGDEVGDDVPF